MTKSAVVCKATGDGDAFDRCATPIAEQSVVPGAIDSRCAQRHNPGMTDRRIIIDDANYVHFVTFNVYRRRRLLDMDQPKRILLGVLGTLRHEIKLKCLGFVIMPNHVHALIWLPPTHTLRYFMHELKRRSSNKIRQWYADKAANYFREFGFGKRFWQPKYHSFEIYSAHKLEEKLDYMHLNPVRAELAGRAIDWKWSSARWFLQRRPVGIPIEWIDG